MFRTYELVVEVQYSCKKTEQDSAPFINVHLIGANNVPLNSTNF